MSLHILLWLKKAKQNQRGLSPVVIRLTYQKQRRQVATGTFLSESDWARISSGEKIRDKNLQSLKESLETKITKLRKIANTLELEERMSLDTLIELYLSKKGPEITLLQLIKTHNNDLHKRIGKDRTESTYEKYRFLYDKIKRFIKFQYSHNDLVLSRIDSSFIRRFVDFLLIEEGNQHNTIAKYCKNLKHVLAYGKDHGHIKEHPFEGFRIGYKDVDRTYLTASELQKLASHRIANKSLELVRDLFIFQCYTGLAYVDMANLTPKNIIEGVDQKPWLITTRQKTKTRSLVPLLKPPLDIIEMYKDRAQEKGKLLPTYAIQKFNTYLKELALICGLEKNLTSHAGRRTFATTVALGNGVSLESISKMLGHKNTKMTTLYAVVTDIKLSEEMNKLASTLKGQAHARGKEAKD